MNPNTSGKAMLSLLAFGLTLLYTWFWIEHEKYHVKKLFIRAALSSVLFVIIPWCYWLWNFFGGEKPEDPQTIPHAFDYRFFMAYRNTINHLKPLV